MKFPFVVQAELTDAQVERYRHHIDSDASGWHRRFTESIWRVRGMLVAAIRRSG